MWNSSSSDCNRSPLAMCRIHFATKIAILFKIALSSITLASSFPSEIRGFDTLTRFSDISNKINKLQKVPIYQRFCGPRVRSCNGMHQHPALSELPGRCHVYTLPPTISVACAARNVSSIGL